jgi:hypothetical protein
MSKDCFGIEWEEGDNCCEACKEEIHCKDVTMRSKNERRSPSPSPAYRPQAYYPSQSQNFGEVSRTYSVNRMYLTPLDEETWYDRLAKNMLSGALEGVGGEMMIFFKHYKFPPSKKKKE